MGDDVRLLQFPDPRFKLVTRTLTQTATLRSKRTFLGRISQIRAGASIAVAGASQKPL
jgi:hypothetical protein